MLSNSMELCLAVEPWLCHIVRRRLSNPVIRQILASTPKLFSRKVRRRKIEVVREVERENDREVQVEAVVEDRRRGRGLDREVKVESSEVDLERKNVPGNASDLALGKGEYFCCH